MNILSSLILIFLIIIIGDICNRFMRKREQYTLLKRRKGVKRYMPKELIKEFIGKVCTITLYNDSLGLNGKIVAVEDNWLKVESGNGKQIQLINGDMIRNILILPDRYQK